MTSAKRRVHKRKDRTYESSSVTRPTQTTTKESYSPVFKAAIKAEHEHDIFFLRPTSSQLTKKGFSSSDGTAAAAAASVSSDGQ